MKYRADIDGLRSIAILPVLLFHFGFEVFSGGFVGVDIFFVISGFLISSIIVEEIREGRFSYISFYERRIRRLMPLYFSVLVVSLIFALLLFSPREFSAFLDSAVYSLFFASNIYFWNNFGYFDDGADRLPLLHTWSLSVEEQFYIVFPFLLIYLFRSALKNKVFLVLFVLFILGYVLSCVGSYSKPLASYYLLPTRGWELLLGALAYFYRDKFDGIRHPLKADIFLFSMFFILIYFILSYEKGSPFPGPWALPPTLVVFFILALNKADFLFYKLLANKALVYIGLISYSLYMVHQPVVVFSNFINHSSTNPIWYKFFLIAITFAISYLTYRFIESPFRSKSRMDRAMIYKLFFATFFLVLLSLVTLKMLVLYKPATLYSPQLMQVDAQVKPNLGLSDLCDNGQLNPDACQNSAEPEWIVWGDSLGMHVANSMQAANAFKFVQKTLSACPPVLDFSVLRYDHTGKWANKCMANNQAVFDFIKTQPELKYVVLASTFDYSYAKNYYDGQIQNYDRSIALQRLTATIAALEELGKKVVVISPPPLSSFDPGFCYVRSVASGANTEQCNFKAVQIGEATELLSLLPPQYLQINLSRYFCADSGHCISSFNDKPLFKDYIHLTKSGSAYLVNETSFVSDLNSLKEGEQK